MGRHLPRLGTAHLLDYVKDIDVFIGNALLRQLVIMQDPGVKPNTNGLPGLPAVRHWPARRSPSRSCRAWPP